MLGYPLADGANLSTGANFFTKAISSVGLTVNAAGHSTCQGFDIMHQSCRGHRFGHKVGFRAWEFMLIGHHFQKCT